MKKALYIIGSVLEVVLLLGAYMFNYFTKSKMGMARFVIFTNQGWQAKYPLETWKLAAVAAIAVLTTLLLAVVVKQRERLTIDIRFSAAAMTVLSFSYSGFTLLLSVDKMRAYYFVSMMLGLTACIQLIKVFMKLIRKK